MTTLFNDDAFEDNSMKHNTLDDDSIYDVTLLMTTLFNDDTSPKKWTVFKA